MTLSIKNDGYAFLTRLNVFYVIMKRVPIVKTFIDLSNKNLIKLILYENDVKLLRLNILREVLYRSICDMLDVLHFDYQYLKRIHQKKMMEWLISFSIVNLILRCILFKKMRNSMNLVPCQKQLEHHQHLGHQ